MVKTNLKNLIEEAKIQITGTKKPSKNTIIVVLIISMISVAGGYYFGKGMDKLNERVDADIYINPYIETIGDKQYLPLIIENLGDKSIKNGVVHISTCDMIDSDGKKYYENYPVPLIQEKSQFEVKFANRDTITSFLKKNCSPEVPMSERVIGISFNPYSDEIETIHETGCGICYYDVNFESDQINKKFVNYFFSSPVNVTITIGPRETRNDSVR